VNKLLFTILVLIFCLFTWQNSYAQDQMPTEYDVKAVFLYNFINFVDWPDSSFANNNDPFIIGICGDDSFDGSLSDIVKGEKVNGTRSIIVKQAKTTSELQDCHMIFCTSSEEKEIDRLLGLTDNKSILTIGESDNFTGEGGMIGFINNDGRVRFELNIKAINKADLRVDSRLQRVAKKVIK